MTSRNLADLFERVVDEVPEREAVVCEEARLTFASLDRRANALAHWLIAEGVAPGDTVGLALLNHAEHLAALLALLKIRAVPVNVNLRYRAEELQRLLTDAGAVGLLHEPGAEAVEAARAGLGALRVLADRDELLAVSRSGPTERPAITRSDDDLYVLYTGGTTGQPRGVVWRHADLVLGALDDLGAAGGPDLVEARSPIASSTPARLLPACPLTHGTAQWVTFRVLLTGGAVVLDPSPSLLAERIWDLVDAEQVSRLAVVGDAVARPLADALDEDPDRWSLESLVVVASGGAVLSPTVRTQLLAHLPGAAIVDGFGSSESGGHGRMVVFPGQRQSFSTGLLRFVPDETTAVLDDDLEPLPPGSPIVGRLARRGPIPLGYLGDPERSAATFPEVHGVRWAVPGDLATLDADGQITVLGRGDSTINSGGEKVYAEEVEVVLRSFPGVLDAIVVGIPDARWGSRVAAVVSVRTGGPGIDDATLGSYCREHLAGFKVPRTMLICDEVRRSPSGKADLRWARQVLSSLSD